MNLNSNPNNSKKKSTLLENLLYDCPGDQDGWSNLFDKYEEWITKEEWEQILTCLFVTFTPTAMFLLWGHIDPIYEALRGKVDPLEVSEELRDMIPRLEEE